ncbi:hypothetical protein GQ42DRAFT_171147 [Ramicandelaber brevisporus]|nr:hypothetical protein GQ42DRAFT_171147 [Ramicandelaber brevisporus]
MDTSIVAVDSLETTTATTAEKPSLIVDNTAMSNTDSENGQDPNDCCCCCCCDCCYRCCIPFRPRIPHIFRRNSTKAAAKPPSISAASTNQTSATVDDSVKGDVNSTSASAKPARRMSLRERTVARLSTIVSTIVPGTKRNGSPASTSASAAASVSALDSIDEVNEAVASSAEINANQTHDGVDINKPVTSASATATDSPADTPNTAESSKIEPAGIVKDSEIDSNSERSDIPSDVTTSQAVPESTSSPPQSQPQPPPQLQPQPPAPPVSEPVLGSEKDGHSGSFTPGSYVDLDDGGSSSSSGLDSTVDSAISSPELVSTSSSTVLIGGYCPTGLAAFTQRPPFAIMSSRVEPHPNLVNSVRFANTGKFRLSKEGGGVGRAIPTSENTLQPPHPTTKWWLNLTLGNTMMPVAPYPYLVRAYPPASSDSSVRSRRSVSSSGSGMSKAEPAGLTFSMPEHFTTPDTTQQLFTDDWTIGVSSPGITSNALQVPWRVDRSIESWDDMSVTMVWQRVFDPSYTHSSVRHSSSNSSNSNNSSSTLMRQLQPLNVMRTTLIKGSPFITMEISQAAFRDGGSVALMTPHLLIGQVQTQTIASGRIAQQPISTARDPFTTTRDHNLADDATRGTTNKRGRWVIYATSIEPAIGFGSTAEYPQAAGVQWRSELMGIVGTKLEPLAPFSGYVSMVWLPHDASNIDELISVLDKHAAVYPVGGSVSFAFGNTAAIAEQQTAASIAYSFDVRGVVDADEQADIPSKVNNSLLMLALPHHIDVLNSSVSLSAPLDASKAVPATSLLDGLFPCIKGALTPIVGNHWSMTEVMPNYDFFARGDIALADIPALLDALQHDISTALGSVVSQDPYFAGKELARIARLVVITEHTFASIGSTASGAAESCSASGLPDDTSGLRKSLLDKALAALEHHLAPWLASINSNPFRFEDRWGGVCSHNGLSDTNADFGNGLYNDHHFHFGYFTYAAAVIARHDPAWLLQPALGSTALAEQLYSGTGSQPPIRLDAVVALLRDYCSVDRNDGFYAFARHKDLFDFHSWASGVTPFPDGCHQESSSEAVNAYYAAYLFGLALPTLTSLINQTRDNVDTSISNGNDNVSNNLTLAHFGALFMQMEIRAAQMYYHHRSQPTSASPYREQFSSSGPGTIGILFASKADHRTWFSTQPEHIFLIQALPFTPAARALLATDGGQWARQVWPRFTAQALLEPSSAEDHEPLRTKQLSADTGTNADQSKLVPMPDSWREYAEMFRALVDKVGSRRGIESLRTTGDRDDGNSYSNALYWVLTV